MSSLAESVPIDRAEPQVGPAIGVALSPQVGRGALAGLAIVMPFERTLVELPGAITVTTVEAVAIVVIGVSALMFASRRMRPHWPPWVCAGVCVLSAFTVAALVAPVERGNAVRLVGRLGMAALIVVSTATLVDRVDRARRLAQVFLATATVVAAIAVLELAQVPAVTSALTSFRPGFHLVGGQLRATSTLIYPTIASMYLEVAFAIGLWLLLDCDASTRRTRMWTLATLAIVGAGVAATFTRAGLIGMAVAIGVTAAIVHARIGLTRQQVVHLATLAALVIASIFALHSPELLAARLSTEGSQAWYGVRYDVPRRLQLETGQVHRVPLSLTNTGRLTWDSTRDPRFNLSYHWLRGDSELVVQFEGQRTAFDEPVAPGQTVAMMANVIAPPTPGDYTLVWDVVHEARAWLSAEGVTPARTVVRVEGEAVAAVPTTRTRLPDVVVRPERPALWGAALAIAADHPVVGVGPDNFRHVYGRYLGLERADPRVHANNMYLEALTGAGALGLIALAWLLAASGRALVARCRTVPAFGVVPAAAMLSAWLMVAGHGFVDSFLSFTTTYMTFAMAAGLAFARAWNHAHRL